VSVPTERRKESKHVVHKPVVVEPTHPANSLIGTHAEPSPNKQTLRRRPAAQAGNLTTANTGWQEQLRLSDIALGSWKPIETRAETSPLAWPQVKLVEL